LHSLLLSRFPLNPQLLIRFPAVLLHDRFPFFYERIIFIQHSGKPSQRMLRLRHVKKDDFRNRCEPFLEKLTHFLEGLVACRSRCGERTEVDSASPESVARHWFK
jgi:hypothetical protein